MSSGDEIFYRVPHKTAARTIPTLQTTAPKIDYLSRKSKYFSLPPAKGEAL
jgi:hypothetical protein